MNRKLAGVAIALCLAATGSYADSDAIKNCIAQWTTSCNNDCEGNGKCQSLCTTQAHDKCTRNIAQAQQTFSGPVTAAPAACTEDTLQVSACSPRIITNDDVVLSQAPATCSQLTGTVANKNFYGGSVVIYVVCPANARVNQPGSTTIVGETCSDPSTGAFTINASNACSGQTGCYGLIAVAPGPVSLQSTEQSCPGNNSTTSPGDPNWSTCTSSTCPDI